MDAIDGSGETAIVTRALPDVGIPTVRRQREATIAQSSVAHIVRRQS
jgi:hypothetical protein